MTTARSSTAGSDAANTVKRIVRDGQASGAFGSIASADTVTFTIFGVVNELPTWFRPTGRKRPSQLGHEVADLVLAGLRPCTEEQS